MLMLRMGARTLMNARTPQPAQWMKSASICLASSTVNVKKALQDSIVRRTESALTLMNVETILTPVHPLQVAKILSVTTPALVQMATKAMAEAATVALTSTNVQSRVASLVLLIRFASMILVVIIALVKMDSKVTLYLVESRNARTSMSANHLIVELTPNASTQKAPLTANVRKDFLEILAVRVSVLSSEFNNQLQHFSV